MRNGQKSSDKALMVTAGTAVTALVLAVFSLFLWLNWSSGPPSAVKTGSPQHTPFDAKTREEVRDFVAEEVERQAGRSLQGFGTFASVLFAAVTLFIVVALAVLGLTWWRQTREYDRLMTEARRCHDEVAKHAQETEVLAKKAGEQLGAIEVVRDQAQAILAQAQKASDQGQKASDQAQKAARTTKADRHLTQALTYQNQGDWDSAIEEYTQFIAAKPTASAYGNRGYAWAKKGEYDKAIEDFDRAIDLAPEVSRYYSNRGIACLEKAEPEKAIEDFKRAVELKATGLGFTNLAEGLIVGGRYREAKAKIDEAVRRRLMTGEEEQLTGPYLKGLALALAGEPTGEEERTLESCVSRGMKARGWRIGALDRYLLGLKPEDFPPGAVEAARRIHDKFKEAVD